MFSFLLWYFYIFKHHPQIFNRPSLMILSSRFREIISTKLVSQTFSRYIITEFFCSMKMCVLNRGCAPFYRKKACPIGWWGSYFLCQQDHGLPYWDGRDHILVSVVVLVESAPFILVCISKMGLWLSTQSPL